MRTELLLHLPQKGDFVIKQSTIGELSNKNLSGKTYKGLVPGWVGNMTGPEVVAFLFEKAAESEGGYDPAHAMDYTQLVSKFLMGAVTYNQAVDNYLDEKLEADNKTKQQTLQRWCCIHRQGACLG